MHRELTFLQLYNSALDALHGVPPITVDAFVEASSHAFLLVFAFLFTHPLFLIAQPTNPVSHITVVGVVNL